MCFGSKKDAEDDDLPTPRPAQDAPFKMSNNPFYAPPTGPPPGYSEQQQQQQTSGSSDYAPPPGPPPNRAEHDLAAHYAPPPGPPPGHHQSQTPDYAPPPGPPPPRQDYARPPGPPPGHAAGSSEPPKHDWQTAVPDTALWSLPPAYFESYDSSPTNNATKEEAEAGEEFCARNPLGPPMVLDLPAASALRTHDIRLIAPEAFSRPTKHPRHHGTHPRNSLTWNPQSASWHVLTNSSCRDFSLFSYPPLYSVNTNSPYPGQPPRTIYYEARFSPDRAATGDQIRVALGFTTLPYPMFRLPGWHRGSLACHGDDGRRYINDRWGGKDFMDNVPFCPGQTVGMGMVFTPRGGGGGTEGGGFEVKVFQTRDGKLYGEWDLHEERDAQTDLPVTGLEGYHDLCASVGVFEKVDFQVFFKPETWLYRGVGTDA